MPAVDDINLWRALHETLLALHGLAPEGHPVDARTRRAVEGTLEAWRGASRARLGAAAHLGTRGPRRRSGTTDLPAQHDLFALGVLHDHLISWAVPHAATAAGGLPPVLDGSLLTLRTQFLEAIGLEPFEHADHFSPVHHELVTVVPDDALDRVVVEDVLWPGLRLRDLLLFRAGVVVRSPRWLLEPRTATSSTLWFTNRRATRPADDLSHGWGSNSRWATGVSRFYVDHEGVHLNWDGDVDIATADPVLSPGCGSRDDEDPLWLRRQLLVHRCRVTGPPATQREDHMPYTDRMSLSRSRWPLREEDLLPEHELRVT